MGINNKRKTVPRLTIANLSSAFLLLGVGYCCALVAFVLEKRHFICADRDRQSSTSSDRV